jgi:hypothetical protein
MSGMTLAQTFGDLRALWRDLHSPTDDTLRAALAVLRDLNEEGAELVRVVEKKRTRLAFSALVAGGISLNVLNAILIEKRFDNSTGSELQILIALVAHEARHAQQGYWVDSIQQELRSYQTQVRVAEKLGLQVFAPLEPLLRLGESPADLSAAQDLITNLFPNTPAQTLYRALPNAQPTGFATFPAALRQLRALARAAQGVQSSGFA